MSRRLSTRNKRPSAQLMNEESCGNKRVHSGIDEKSSHKTKRTRQSSLEKGEDCLKNSEQSNDPKYLEGTTKGVEDSGTTTKCDGDSKRDTDGEIDEKRLGRRDKSQDGNQGRGHSQRRGQGRRGRRKKVVEVDNQEHEESAKSQKKSDLDDSVTEDYGVQVTLWESQIQQLGFSKCPLCYCRRNYVASMLKHYKECFAQRPDSYPCRHCQREFQSSAGLKYHLMAEHCDTDAHQSNEEQPELERADLFRILRHVGRITCPTDECKKSFTTVNGYKYHQGVCGKESAEIKCESCGKIYRSSAGLSYHMKTIHTIRSEEQPVQHPVEQPATPEGGGRVKRKAAQKALKSMHDLTQNLKESSSETTNDKKTKKKRRNSLSDSGSDSIRFDDNDEDSDDDFDDDFADDVEENDRKKGESERIKVAKPRINFKENLVDFLEEAYRGRVRRFSLSEGHTSAASAFPVDWSSWKQLSPSESSNYIPMSQHSVHFKMQFMDKDEEPISLQLFQSQSSTKAGLNLNLYVGGPVWGMAWCPHTDNADTDTEYAAVSCHQTHDEYHNTDRLYIGPGIVQLWAFTGLENKNQLEPTSKLVCCMAHDCGCIWDLKWCPSGCWQTAAENVAEDSENTNRLGVLAMACSDGSARIFNVPTPKCVQSLAGSSTAPTVLRLNPSLALWPGVAPSGEATPSCGQCWCVDWAPDNGHTKMAAGFSNGCVAVWDLVSQSPLLWVRRSDSPSLLPYRSFEAHNMRVTCVSWCPLDSNFLATTSLDRSVKVWDVRSPDKDLSMCKALISICIACAWTSNLSMLNIAQESDSFVMNKLICYSISKPESLNRGIFTTALTDWGLDVSDWLHCLLFGGSSGDVNFYTLSNCHLSTSRALTQNKHRKRLVYSTEIHPRGITSSDKTSCPTSCLTSCPKNVQEITNMNEAQKSDDSATNTSHDRVGKTCIQESQVKQEQVDGTHQISETSVRSADKELSVMLDTENLTNRIKDSNVVARVDLQQIDASTGDTVSRGIQENSLVQENTSGKGKTSNSGKSSKSRSTKLEEPNSKRHRRQVVTPQENENAVFGNTYQELNSTDKFSSPKIQQSKSLTFGSPLSVITQDPNSGDFVDSRSIPKSTVVLRKLCERVSTNHEQSGSKRHHLSEKQKPDSKSGDAQSLRHEEPESSQNQEPRSTICQDFDASNLQEKDSSYRETRTENNGPQKSHKSAKQQNLKTSTSSRSQNSSCNSGAPETSAKNSKDCKSRMTCGKLATFSEFVEKAYIMFNDSVMDSMKNKKWEKRSSVDSVKTCMQSIEEAKQRPLVAVHRTCFNPNLGTHAWILSGGQTGIVRAHRITALHSQQVDKCVKKMKSQTPEGAVS